MDWATTAAALAPGGRKDIEHDCGEGPKLRVSKDARGALSCYCFRCHWKDWRPAPAESLAERTARLAKQAAADTALKVQALPAPAVHDMRQWPDGARLWLHKAGLSQAEVAKLGAFWHAKSDRVVIPIRDDAGALIFWQARAYQPGRQPKYLSQDGGRPSSFLVRYGRGPGPVITEDVLSAFKVGLAGFEAWPMMGTAPSHRMLAELSKKPRVVVWLDPDKPGRTAAARLCKTLRARGVRVHNLVTDRDPKLLFRQTIAEVLHHLWQDR